MPSTYDNESAVKDEQGFVAPNGSKFQITQVKRLIDRISE